MYFKNCKKQIGNTISKNLVLTSKNKIKGKSKCAICLTERAFTHKIEGKYGLESELGIYLQFLLADVIKEHEVLLREV